MDLEPSPGLVPPEGSGPFTAATTKATLQALSRFSVLEPIPTARKPFNGPAVTRATSKQCLCMFCASAARSAESISSGTTCFLVPKLPCTICSGSCATPKKPSANWAALLAIWKASSFGLSQATPTILPPAPSETRKALTWLIGPRNFWWQTK